MRRAAAIGGSAGPGANGIVALGPADHRATNGDHRDQLARPQQAEDPPVRAFLRIQMQTQI